MVLALHSHAVDAVNPLAYSMHAQTGQYCPLLQGDAQSNQFQLLALHPLHNYLYSSGLNGSIRSDTDGDHCRIGTPYEPVTSLNNAVDPLICIAGSKQRCQLFHETVCGGCGHLGVLHNLQGKLNQFRMSRVMLHPLYFIFFRCYLANLQTVSGYLWLVTCLLGFLRCLFLFLSSLRFYLRRVGVLHKTEDGCEGFDVLLAASSAILAVCLKVGFCSTGNRSGLLTMLTRQASWQQGREMVQGKTQIVEEKAYGKHEQRRYAEDGSRAISPEFLMAFERLSSLDLARLEWVQHQFGILLLHLAIKSVKKVTQSMQHHLGNYIPVAFKILKLIFKCFEECKTALKFKGKQFLRVLFLKYTFFVLYDGKYKMPLFKYNLINFFINIIIFMRVLILVALVVALTAVHLESEDANIDTSVAISRQCRVALESQVDNEDGKLVIKEDGKNYHQTCTKIKLNSLLFDCTLSAKCRNHRGVFGETSLDLPSKLADICCP